MTPIEAAYSEYSRAETVELANEIEATIERTFVDPIPEPWDDQPTVPISIDVSALRRSLGEVVVVRARSGVNRHTCRRG